MIPQILGPRKNGLECAPCAAGWLVHSQVMQPVHRDISWLGRLRFRNSRTRFGIRQSDRLSHLYVVGKTGVGKSTLLAQLALQDIEAGRGIALIDPHGDLARRVLALAPPASAPHHLPERH